MDVVNTILLVVLLIAVVALALRSGRRDDGQALLMMQQQIDNLRTELARALEGNTTAVSQHLQQIQTSMGGILPKLGQLDNATANLLTVSRGIEEFQKSLLVPKTRGGVGEVILEHILSQMLPREHFAVQHTFRSGKQVDALIVLGNGTSISVDAKFPLQSFTRLGSAETEKDRVSLKKLFLKDVRGHIDRIAERYILPDEGTLDFAMMYIPVEGVYYETIVTDTPEEEPLFEYALARKVIPVSPNTFYAYLQTILLGLKALRVESSAQAVLAHLAQLKNDYAKVADGLALAGRHLGNLKSAFEGAERASGDFRSRLEKS